MTGAVCTFQENTGIVVVLRKYFSIMNYPRAHTGAQTLFDPWVVYKPRGQMKGLLKKSVYIGGGAGPASNYR